MKGKVIVAALACLFLAGCAGSKSRAYKSPDTEMPPLKNVMINMNGFSFDFEEAFIDSFCDDDSIRQCVLKNQLFPPTRRYQSEEVVGVLARENIDSVIRVGATRASYKERDAGSLAFLSGSSTANTFNASATSVSMTAFSRVERYYVDVWNVDASEIAMRIDASTKGQGMVNVTDSAFANALASEIKRQIDNR
ncbi:hypothetical protein HLG76_06330 [Salinivibrio sp. EAGSL]|uniref:hypothetical protein n=1 Tax=Salinivibrio sp. EAGSL TaxID=2738468 RepID=UPI00158D87A2|nr:hypothetical protein [Salinivibrio sp. EAGSL]NUY56187.1 hypothetical protein [Salinivibrio sp. EAGSL]